MSPVGEWVEEMSEGREVVEVYAPHAFHAALAGDGIVVVGEHPERPWLVVVVCADGETSCNPGVTP